MNPRTITAIFVMITIIGAGPYYVLSAFASIGGPPPDYGIATLLVIPIFLHALLISKNSNVEKAKCTLFYVAVVLALCLLRYWDRLHAGGFGQWHANTSLVSFLACSAFFIICFLIFTLRSTKPVSQGPKLVIIPVILWLLIVSSISSYLYSYRQISKLAISMGRYTASQESSFILFYDGDFSPRWIVRFSRKGYSITEIHASLFGRVVFAREKRV